jgi:hypothetical protein
MEIYVYLHLWKTGLTEKSNFRLLAANGKQKRHTSVFVLCRRKTKFVFLGWQTINGNRRLLFQQTCPSMIKNIPMILMGSTYKTFQDETSQPQTQNVPRHKVPATNCSNYKMSQLQNAPRLKTSQLQNVPYKKHLKSARVPTTKHPKYKTSHLKNFLSFKTPQ